MTDRELKVKFFGMHIGCEVKTDCYNNHKGAAHLTKIGLLGNGVPCFEVRLNGALKEFFDGKYTCKLILKPLSEITDEDALKVANVMGYCDESWKVIRTETLITIESDSLDGELWIYLNNIDLIRSFYSEPMSDWSHAIDFLRSKGYALPYMGKHPFEEGWAVPTKYKNKDTCHDVII